LPDKNMKSKGIAIIGGRVIDPSQDIDRLATVLIKGDKIEEITAKPLAKAPDGYDVVDAADQVVTPGFIDVHTHLREPGEEHKETIETGTAAAARGGFTTICAMPNTDPVQDNANVIAAVLKLASDFAAVRVLPIGAVTLGRRGKQLADMAELANAGVIGFSDDGDPVTDPNLMRQALLYASGLGLPIMNHPQEPALTRGAQMNEGPIANRLGLTGWPNEAESSMVARDVELVALTGGRLHECHISARESIHAIRRAKERGLNVTAEVTPHHLTLTDTWVLGEHGEDSGGVGATAYDTSTKVNPPLRTQEDVDAVIAALADGTIDLIATDHAPHAQTDKICTYQEAANGIANLETAFASVLSLHHSDALSLPVLIERMTAAPGRFLSAATGGTELGILKAGSGADVTIFDPDVEWTVDPSEMATLGKHTPLAGTSLKGRVTTTIFGGTVVWDGTAVASIG
jgi:dihydroorotase